MAQKQKLPFTPIQKLLETLCGLVLLSSAIILAVLWSSVPDPAPSYGFDGSISEWIAKNLLMLYPILALVIFSLISGSLFLIAPRQGEQSEQKKQIYRTTRTFLCTVNLEIMVLFGYLALSSALSNPLIPYFLLGILLFFFVTIILFCILVLRRVRACFV